MGAARQLAAAAFGVPEEVGAIVYADEVATREDCRVWGLFEAGRLVSCVLNVYVGVTLEHWQIWSRPRWALS